MKKKLLEKIITHGYARSNRFEYKLEDNIVYKRPLGSFVWERTGKVVEA